MTEKFSEEEATDNMYQLIGTQNKEYVPQITAKNAETIAKMGRIRWEVRE